VSGKKIISDHNVVEEDSKSVASNLPGTTLETSVKPVQTKLETSVKPDKTTLETSGKDTVARGVTRKQRNRRYFDEFLVNEIEGFGPMPETNAAPVSSPLVSSVIFTSFSLVSSVFSHLPHSFRV
jgi:hypothetical protein